MKKLLLLLLSWVLFQVAYSQDLQLGTISSGGLFSTSQDIQFGSVLGEICIASYSKNNVSLSEGFCQHYDMTTETVFSLINLEIKVYPNPFSQNITVEFDEQPHDLTQVNLYRINGSKVLSKKISAEEYRISIDLNSFISGSYLLNIVNEDNKLIHSSKIIKSKR